MIWESPNKFKIDQNFNRHNFHTTNFCYDKIQYVQTLLINAFKITRMLSDWIFDGTLEFICPELKKNNLLSGQRMHVRTFYIFTLYIHHWGDFQEISFYIEKRQLHQTVNWLCVTYHFYYFEQGVLDPALVYVKQTILLRQDIWFTYLKLKCPECKGCIFNFFLCIS